jgi:hypothetical protein
VKAEEEAAAKKARQEAKDIYKAETGKAAPKCYGDYNQYRGDCRSCEAAEACALFGGVEYAEPPVGKPECFGEGTEDLDECEECKFVDECSAIVDPESCIDDDMGRFTAETDSGEAQG